MSIKRGDVVTHSGAIEWGVGKVIEVSAYRVSIHFNDGITRKIASSHFMSLLPAEPASFKPVVPIDAKVATKTVTPRKKATTSKTATGKQTAAKQTAP